MKKIFLFLFILLSPFLLFSQKENCWNVLIVKKGNSFKEKEDLASYSTSGFYLQRNCVYDFTTQKGEFISGRLIDVKPDTLFFSNYLNEAVAKKNNGQLDTLAFHIRALSKIRVVGDRSLGLYQKYDLDKHDFIFEEETECCLLESFWEQIYINDSSLYEIVPHFTAQGIGFLFEELGVSYFFYGSGMTKPEYSEIDSTYDVRKGIWFTPCKVEKIDGLAIGLLPQNIKNDFNDRKDSLVINGLNVDLLVFGYITIFDPPWTGYLPDSIEFYNEKLKSNPMETTVNGINIGSANTIGESKVNGINITSLFTVIGEINGLSISGLSNFSYKLKGVSIAALHNRATEGKGVQIGLVNKATDMRGIQIGLWNKNGKRSLPFINWQFKK